MHILLKKDLWLDNERGVVSAGTVVEVLEQRGRDLLQCGYGEEAEAEAVNGTGKPAKIRGKARAGAPENKAVPVPEQKSEPVQDPVQAPALDAAADGAEGEAE